MAPTSRDSKDLTIGELQEICNHLSLNKEGMTTKEEVLKVVQAWEKDLTNTKEDLDALQAWEKELTNAGDESDLHDGKKIISKTPKTVNGVEYNEILVEGGVTFLAKK